MACIILLLLYSQVCFPLEVKFETKDNLEYKVEIPDDSDHDQEFEIAIPKKYGSYPPTIADRIRSDKGSPNKDLDVFGHSQGVHHPG